MNEHVYYAFEIIEKTMSHATLKEKNKAIGNKKNYFSK